MSVDSFFSRFVLLFEIRAVVAEILSPVVFHVDLVGLALHDVSNETVAEFIRSLDRGTIPSKMLIVCEPIEWPQFRAPIGIANRGANCESSSGENC